MTERRILFLDDEEERRKEMIQIAAGEKDLQVNFYITAQGAILRLNAMGPSYFDAILLDHDLEEQHYGTGWCDRECGCEVVDAILKGVGEEKGVDPPFVIIHSHNEDVAPRMRDRLVAGGIPSIWLPWDKDFIPWLLPPSSMQRETILAHGGKKL